jgi:hypothetical protein
VPRRWFDATRIFSLWFPLFTTLLGAWVTLDLAPAALGATPSTLLLFQPDLGLVMIASAATGVPVGLVRAGSGVRRSGRSCAGPGASTGS